MNDEIRAKIAYGVGKFLRKRVSVEGSACLFLPDPGPAIPFRPWEDEKLLFEQLCLYGLTVQPARLDSTGVVISWLASDPSDEVVAEENTPQLAICRWMAAQWDKGFATVLKIAVASDGRKEQDW